MKVYLAGPINGCSDAEATDWREAIKSRVGAECIDPMKRDYRVKELANYREIVELDKLEVVNSDCLVVMYSNPSVGTSMEILYAWERGTPVLLIDSQNKPLSPWLIYHATSIVKTIDEAIEKLNFWFGV